MNNIWKRQEEKWNGIENKGRNGLDNKEEMVVVEKRQERGWQIKRRKGRCLKKIGTKKRREGECTREKKENRGETEKEGRW